MRFLKDYEGYQLQEEELINQDPRVLSSSPPEPDFEHVVLIFENDSYVGVADSVKAAEDHIDFMEGR